MQLPGKPRAKEPADAKTDYLLELTRRYQSLLEDISKHSEKLTETVTRLSADVKAKSEEKKKLDVAHQEQVKITADAQTNYSAVDAPERLPELKDVFLKLANDRRNQFLPEIAFQNANNLKEFLVQQAGPKRNQELARHLLENKGASEGIISEIKAYPKKIVEFIRNRAIDQLPRQERIDAYKQALLNWLKEINQKKGYHAAIVGMEKVADQAPRDRRYKDMSALDAFFSSYIDEITKIPPDAKKIQELEKSFEAVIALAPKDYHREKINGLMVCLKKPAVREMEKAIDDFLAKESSTLSRKFGGSKIAHQIKAERAKLEKKESKSPHLAGSGKEGYEISVVLREIQTAFDQFIQQGMTIEDSVKKPKAQLYAHLGKCIELHLLDVEEAPIVTSVLQTLYGMNHLDYQLNDPRTKITADIKQLNNFFASEMIRLEQEAERKKLEEKVERKTMEPSNAPSILTVLENLSNFKGLDVLLISIENKSDIEEQIIIQARVNNTPILIKEKNKFFIYGDADGIGSWTFTEIKQGLDEIQKLPFEKGIIRKNDPKFTSSLIETLKKGHAHFEIRDEKLRDELKKVSDDKFKQIEKTKEEAKKNLDKETKALTEAAASVQSAQVELTSVTGKFTSVSQSLQEIVTSYDEPLLRVLQANVLTGVQKYFQAFEAGSSRGAEGQAVATELLSNVLTSKNFKDAIQNLQRILNRPKKHKWSNHWRDNSCNSCVIAAIYNGLFNCSNREQLVTNQAPNAQQLVSDFLSPLMGFLEAKDGKMDSKSVTPIPARLQSLFVGVADKVEFVEKFNSKHPPKLAVTLNDDMLKGVKLEVEPNKFKTVKPEKFREMLGDRIILFLKEFNVVVSPKENKNLQQEQVHVEPEAKANLQKSSSVLQNFFRPGEAANAAVPSFPKSSGKKEHANVSTTQALRQFSQQGSNQQQSQQERPTGQAPSGRTLSKNKNSGS